MKKMFGGVMSGIGDALTSKPLTYQRGAMKKVASAAKPVVTSTPQMRKKATTAIADRMKAIKDQMKD